MSAAVGTIRTVVTIMALGVGAQVLADRLRVPSVVFLLAGVLPLGLAMQRTGGDALLSSLLAGSAAVLAGFGLLFCWLGATALL